MLKVFVYYFHSLLQEMRCQVHSELAVIEEEEGRLEASLTHLQKAMLLDNGTQGERLSSALRLLQLRATLYQTPSRAEDKAAKLMQQVFSSSSSNVHAVYSFNETGVTHVIGMPKSASNSILLLHGAVEVSMAAQRTLSELCQVNFDIQSFLLFLRPETCPPKIRQTSVPSWLLSVSFWALMISRLLWMETTSPKVQYTFLTFFHQDKDMLSMHH